jgi:hypothetical protein
MIISDKANKFLRIVAVVSFALILIAALVVLLSCTTTPSPPISPIDPPVYILPATISAESVVTQEVSIWWSLDGTQVYTNFVGLYPASEYRLFCGFYAEQDGAVVLTATIDTGVVSTDTLGSGEYASLVLDIWDTADIVGDVDVYSRMYWRGPTPDGSGGDGIVAYGRYHVRDDGTIEKCDIDGWCYWGKLSLGYDVYMPLVIKDS